MPEPNVVDKAYQSLFTAISGYSQDVGKSYRGGVIELASRLDSTIRVDQYGRRVDKYDFLGMIKEGQGELANWKTDTRMQMIRDIETVVSQFSQLELTVDTALEAMCDSDTVNGGLKFDITSKNQQIDGELLVQKLESKYQIKYHLKSTGYKQTIKHGEFFPMVKPISKIINYAYKHKDAMMESATLFESVTAVPDEDNKSSSKKKPKKKNESLKLLYESAEAVLNEAFDTTVVTVDAKKATNFILGNITLQPSFEKLMFDEYGEKGLELLSKEFGFKMSTKSGEDNLFESVVDGFSDKDFAKDDINKFDSVKGCYIRWMNATQLLPIKVGNIDIGYYYIHYANSNIQNKSSFGNGIIDISQTTSLSSSKDFMQRLSDMIIENLELPFLKKHVGMVDEIAQILMENQFRKKSVSFTYIPKEDIIPFKINIDTDGNGNSMFAKSISSARLYTMLLTNNILTILNNRPSRIWKVKRDPRTNNIAATIQSFKEKIYSKRIGVDDVWSYNGAMNKIGSPNDMVVPVDADGTPPFTKDYDEGHNIQLNSELMEMLKKDAVALSGVPNAIINQQDEVEYSKLAQMAQLKLLDFVKGLKIDLNPCTTALYRRLFEIEFNLTEEQASSVTVLLPDVRSNDLNIIADMVQTFNSMFDILVQGILTQEEMTTADNKPSNVMKLLKYELMKVFVPSIDWSELEKIKNKILRKATGDSLTDQKRGFVDFSDDEIAGEPPQA